MLLEVYLSDQVPTPQVKNQINKIDQVRVSKYSSKTQDFALPWLSQYVVRLYNEFEKELKAREDAEPAPSLQEQRGIVQIDGGCFDDLTVKYANQLACEQNFELALALCLFLEDRTL